MAKESRSLVLYHGSCSDGFGAAWAAKEYMDRVYDEVVWEACYRNTRIQENPLEFSHVYVLDYSFPSDTLLDWAEETKVTVIDHHKTAKKDLEGITHKNLTVVFDMDKSGAMLSWEHFNSVWAIPTLIKYVQDRDLWNWDLESSKEVNAAIEMLEFDFDEWFAFEHELEESFGLIVTRGENFLSYKDNQVKRIAKRAYMTCIGGYSVPCVNSSLFASEIGNVLCQEYPFAAVYFLFPNGSVGVSLRSNAESEDAVDVEEIASKMGGGGHKNAAGYRSNSLLLESS